MTYEEEKALLHQCYIKLQCCKRKKPRDVFDEPFCSNSGLIMCLMKNYQQDVQKKVLTCSPKALYLLPGNLKRLSKDFVFRWDEGIKTTLGNWILSLWITEKTSK